MSGTQNGRWPKRSKNKALYILEDIEGGPLISLSVRSDGTMSYQVMSDDEYNARLPITRRALALLVRHADEILSPIDRLAALVDDPSWLQRRGTTP